MPDVSSYLPHWLWPGDDRPRQEIDDEIAEELRFHLDMLAEECERGGVDSEAAKRDAAERFGDFDGILRRCRVEKQGDVPVLKRLQMALTGMLAAAVVFIGWQQWAMANRAEATWHVMNGISGRLSDISDRLHVIEPLASSTPPATAHPPAISMHRGTQPGSPYAGPIPAHTNRNTGWTPPNGPVRTGQTVQGPNGEQITIGTPIGAVDDGENYTIVKREPRGDVTGVVYGADGEPVAGADVLLILKDWPSGRFRQRDKAIETDAEGRFTMKRAVPLDGQYGVNAAVVAPGHAIASRYVLVESPEGQAPTPLEFRLERSAKVRLRVTDGDGEPLAKTLVAPAGRGDAENEDHIVYHQGSNSAWRRTSADGEVEVGWFAAGDVATVRLRPRGGAWAERRFEAPADGGEVTLVAE